MRHVVGTKVDQETLEKLENDLESSRHDSRAAWIRAAINTYLDRSSDDNKQLTGVYRENESIRLIDDDIQPVGEPVETTRWRLD